MNCLLIDDDQDDHEFFSIALKEAFPNATCSFATDFSIVIEKITRNPIVRPDYVFMDWNLCGMDPITCLNDLRAFSFLHDAPIFILTGQLPPLPPGKFEELGIKKVLIKQASIESLALELKVALKE